MMSSVLENKVFGQYIQLPKTDKHNQKENTSTSRKHTDSCLMLCNGLSHTRFNPFDIIWWISKRGKEYKYLLIYQE